MRSTIQERVMRRLLIESAFGKVAGLGAFVTGEGYDKAAFLYDTNMLIDYLRYGEEFIDKPIELEELSNRPTSRKEAVDRILKGYIKIGGSANSCQGAAIVAYAAGPGYGKELYGVAYAMSPTGLLAADRGAVSNSAGRAWAKAADSGRGRRKFDDRYHRHSEEGNEYHTDDPKDDCSLHFDRDHLNYAYEAEGWEKGLLDYLTAQHEETMLDLTSSAKMRAQVEELLSSVARNEFWRRHYRGSSF